MFKGMLKFLKISKGLGKGVLFFNILYYTLNEISSLLPIFFIKFILDIITQGREFNILVRIVLLFSFTYFGIKLVNSIIWYFADTRCQNIILGMDFKFMDEIEKFDYKVFEQDKYLNKIEKSSKFYQEYLQRKLGNAIGKIVKFISIIGIIASLNIWILLFLILIFGLNSILKDIVNKKLYKIQRKKVVNERKINYLEKLTREREFGKEIRINNLKDYFLSNLKKEQEILFQKDKKIIKINTILLGYFITATNFLKDIIIYLYIGISVLLKYITIGSFTMYIQAISTFSSTLNELIDSILELKMISLSYEDYLALDELPHDIQKGGKNFEYPEKSHCIEFKNVSFKYPNNETYILKNINININKGEKLAIVGENGAGKTTFIKLLIRLYDVTEGEILLDGINIKEIDYKSYMNALSVVFQDFKLFYESIKENVALSKIDIATDEEILEVLEKSGLKESINKLKKGINTTLYKEFDDEGIELSGGEGQKLCLARALYKNGGIVILDEPTSALDPRSEYDLYMKFNELVENKTSIYISHRLSSTRFCDNIAVFEDGEIVEYGTHNDLIKKNGIYNELYSKQAEFYK